MIEVKSPPDNTKFLIFFVFKTLTLSTTITSGVKVITKGCLAAKIKNESHIFGEEREGHEGSGNDTI